MLLPLQCTLRLDYRDILSFFYSFYLDENKNVTMKTEKKKLSSALVHYRILCEMKWERERQNIMWRDHISRGVFNAIKNDEELNIKKNIKFIFEREQKNVKQIKLSQPLTTDRRASSRN